MMDTDRKIARMDRRLRRMTAVTLVSVIMAILMLVGSVLVCVYYMYESKKIAASAEKTDGDGSDVTEVSDDGDNASVHVEEGVSYTSDEVDALVKQAEQEGETKGSENLLTMLASRLSNGDSILSILRTLYPDEIVVTDSGRYVFLPIDENLAKSPLDPDLFVQAEQGDLATGFSYTGPEAAQLRGIDVSKYQGEIDWKSVKEAGVDYAILRVGIRGYSEGKLVADDFFEANLKGAKANGIPIGLYFFTQAITEDEAREEAAFVVHTLDDAVEKLEKEMDLQGELLDYPIYIDVEAVNSKNARTLNLSPQERTACVKAFLEEIADSGYKPAIYGNTKSFLLMMDMEQLEEYDKWLASYTLPVYFPYKFSMLQYSEKGEVKGIKGNVDVNLSFQFADETTE